MFGSLSFLKCKVKEIPFGKCCRKNPVVMGCTLYQCLFVAVDIVRISESDEGGYLVSSQYVGDEWQVEVWFLYIIYVYYVGAESYYAI